MSIYGEARVTTRVVESLYQILYPSGKSVFPPKGFHILFFQRVNMPYGKATKRSKANAYRVSNYKRARQMPRHELKRYFSNNGTPTAVPDTGLFRIINNLATGAGSTDRIGKHITTQKLHLRGTLNVADDTNVVRIILFQSLQEPITVVSSLFDTGTTDWLSTINKELARVIWDHTYSMNKVQVAAATFAFKEVVIDKWFKVNLKQTWNSASQVEPNRNGLQVLCISDSAAVSHPTIELYSELFFYDE